MPAAAMAFTVVPPDLTPPEVVSVVPLDGAEGVLTRNRYVRSNTRDDRPDRGRAYWRPGDIDGDGVTG